MPPPIRLIDSSGKQITTGRIIGTGGEGDVHEISGQPDRVVKLYHKMPSAETEHKLRAMLRTATPELHRLSTWPLDIVRHNDRTCGFIMKRLDRDYSSILELYSPVDRKKKFPSADYSFLVHAAMNLVIAFESVHRAGHIVGDVNQKNIHVNRNAMVRLVDCDSFQVQDACARRIYRCTVGVGEYTPPELHGQDFAAITRTRNHDSFGLAVLIFYLLYMGRNPFAGTYLGSGNPPSLDEAVRQFRFAYAGDSEKRCLMKPPSRTVPPSALSQELADLFERAFLPAGQNHRPSPMEWQTALTGFKASLLKCSVNESHCSPGHLRHCIWCQLEDKDKVVYFIGDRIVSTTIPALKLDYDLINELKQLIQEIRHEHSMALPAKPGLTAVTVPRHLKHSKDLYSALSITLILGVVCAVAGLLGSATAFVITVLFFWWLAMRNGNCAYKLALASAQTERDQLTQQYTSEYMVLKEAYQRQEPDLENLLQQAEHSLRDYLRVSHDMQHHLNQLESNKLQLQQDNFLRAIPIQLCQANHIGANRRAVLRSFGIETAADITEARLSQVAGFGPAIRKSLFDWREELLKRFTYDPSRPIPRKEIDRVRQKYHQLSSISREDLLKVRDQLRTRKTQFRTDLGRRQQELRVLQPRVAEAAGRLTALIRL